MSMECKDCGPLPKDHAEMWIEELLGLIFPGRESVPQALQWLSGAIDRGFLRLGLASLDPNPPREKISLRTTVFWDEAKKHDINISAFKTKWGYNNIFLMEVGGRRFTFEGLPLAEHALRPEVDLDDKWLVKKKIAAHGLPHAEGCAFWWFQKARAAEYGEQLGYPLIVKPRAGSMSHHISANIRSRAELEDGISRAIRYAPRFIVERFIPNSRVYRATLVDGKFVAAAERIPAHVMGDGTHTVQELATIKSSTPDRGAPRAKDTTCYRLVIDETSHRLLAACGLTVNSIPQPGERVFIQDKVILDLGADLHEATGETHPENAKMFERAAALFPAGILGLDFLCHDISQPHREQPCAIIELNSLPYIDMHHFPTTGAPVNVGLKIVEMIKKYYR